MGKRKAVKTILETQQTLSASENAKDKCPEIETNKTYVAFNTPEMQCELANFVKLIGCIRSEQRTTNTQALDNDPGKR